MKNEAGLRPMKRAFGSRNIKVRFASYEHKRVLHGSRRLLLHADEVGASLKNHPTYQFSQPLKILGFAMVSFFVFMTVFVSNSDEKQSFF